MTPTEQLIDDLERNGGVSRHLDFLKLAKIVLALEIKVAAHDAKLVRHRAAIATAEADAISPQPAAPVISCPVCHMALYDDAAKVGYCADHGPKKPLANLLEEAIECWQNSDGFCSCDMEFCFDKVYVLASEYMRMRETKAEPPVHPVSVEEWMRFAKRQPWKTIVGTWGWTRVVNVTPGYEQNALPEEIYSALSASGMREEPWWKIYQTRESAIAALEAALKATGEIATPPASPVKQPAMRALIAAWQALAKECREFIARQDQDVVAEAVSTGREQAYEWCAADLSAALASVKMPSDEEMAEGFRQCFAEARQEAGFDVLKSPVHRPLFRATVRWLAAKMMGGGE